MKIPPALAHIRSNYTLQALSKASVLADPLEQFHKWMHEALAAELEEPTAMVLSTANAEGRPSGRVVLLKGIEDKGFVFFTNYASRKGQDLEQNHLAALTFFWAGLERQVRIEGRISRLPEAASEAYFHSRPAGSQIGAWVSPQSQEVENRRVLEDSEIAFEEKFKDEAVIPRPPHWGGYLLLPDHIEFWQGRPNRLHDRIVYEKQAGEAWKIKRLAP